MYWYKKSIALAVVIIALAGYIPTGLLFMLWMGAIVWSGVGVSYRLIKLIL